MQAAARCSALGLGPVGLGCHLTCPPPALCFLLLHFFTCFFTVLSAELKCVAFSWIFFLFLAFSVR